MSEDTGRLVGGRYRLGDVLGRGGMGTVWRGQDEILGRTVAVKELRFPSSVDEDEKQRLITRTLREAKAIARIRSGSAVTVFDVVNEDSRPWIVMELIEGRSLADQIKDVGPLSAQRAAEVGLAILDVLRAAHREGILHRDVKPSNVLLEDNTGRVILTDFGIAKVEGDPSVTSTGMLVGAPSYISPERARGKPPGPPADLWSLGGLLFAAVEGRPPYDKGSAISTLTAVMTEPVPASERAGELSECISGLLVKDPEKRLDVDGARVLLEPVAYGFKNSGKDSGADSGGSDATRTSVLPSQGPGTPSGTSGTSGSPGSSGGEGGGGRRKRRAESGSSADRLRGALKSVRNAASSGVAGATGASSSGASTGTGGAHAAGGAGAGTRKPKDGEGARGRGTSGGTQRKGSGTGAGAGAGAAGAAASSTSGARHSLTKPSESPGASGSSGASAPSKPSTSPTVPPAHKGSPAASSSGELPAEGEGGARTSGTGTGTGTGAGTGPGGGSGSRALPPESGGSGAITSLRDLRELPELRQGISRRMLGLIAAAVVIAVIVVVAVVATASGGEGDGGDEAKNGGSSSGSAGGDAKGEKGGKPAEGEKGGGGSDGKDEKSEPSEKPGKGDDKGEKDGKDGKGALPAGYKTVSDGRFHFSMAMPKGFKLTGVAGKNSGGKYSGGGLPKIQVDFNDSPLADAAGAWRGLEPAVKGSSPGYRPLGIKKTEWRGYPTVADWQFTRQEDGQKVHVLNRGFKVDGKRGYAIMITCKADGWQDKKCATLRKTAFKTFKPTG
ncbi:serine/threonine-protein kinase [Streptomyces sp. NPDC048172]|uniref:serine/threonine-protein kinase n=1 Tax=Streptomyces sp. NPDC048172 TaxID=3365505 RepID=UPI003723FD5D